MFKCNHCYGKFKYEYCAVEKIMLFFSFMAVLLILYQIYVYKTCYRVKWRDNRMKIYGLCCLNAIYLMFHYGVIDARKRGNMYFVIEYFRFFIFYFICLYYSYNASKLLKNSKMVILVLKLWGVFCFVAYIAMTVDI